MSDWAPRIVILAAFAVVLGLPFIWRPPAAIVPDDAERLVIITPHNEQIRYEMGVAFDAWHREHYGKPVAIDWRSMGTADMRRTLLSQYESLAKQGREGEGAGYDLAYGGGDYEFDRKLKPGVTVKTDDGGKRSVSITQAITLDPALVAEVYPSQVIADKELYDPQGHWWGAVLSSFGIVYNRDVLERLDLPEPTTWEDLAHEKLYGWVALADPSHSGSINVTYEAILQRYGYERGWKTLRRACANARYFAESSSKVPIDVSAGEAGVGMCIDFYGRHQAEAVGGDRVGFIAPADATVVTADPIAVLRGAKSPQLARRFIEFVLSVRGQQVWSYHAARSLDDAPDDWPGPQLHALRRMPVRRDMYDTPELRQHMVDQVQPFDIAKPLPDGTPRYMTVMPTVMHAMAMDIHSELKAAWRAIIAEDDPETKAKMIELFDAMPFTPEQLQQRAKAWDADRSLRTQDRLAWTRFFREQYRKIVDLRG